MVCGSPTLSAHSSAKSVCCGRRRWYRCRPRPPDIERKDARVRVQRAQHITLPFVRLPDIIDIAAPAPQQAAILFGEQIRRSGCVLRFHGFEIVDLNDHLVRRKRRLPPVRPTANVARSLT